MSSEVVQTEQRKANLEAITAPRLCRVPEQVRHHAFGDAAGRRAYRDAGGRPRSRARRHRHRRPHRQHPQLRQGQLLRAVRRPLAHPGLRAAGRAQRARLSAVEAARSRRSDRRRRTPVPHQDQRAVDLGLVAAVPGEVLPAAAGEVARPAGRRDPLSPALSRPDRQSRRAARVRDPHRDGVGDPRLPRRRTASSKSRRR